jgi:hypothetical protein
MLEKSRKKINRKVGREHGPVCTRVRPLGVDDRVGQAISGTCQYRLAQRHGPGLSLGRRTTKKSIRVIGWKPIFYIGSSNRYDLYDKK